MGKNYFDNKLLSFNEKNYLKKYIYIFRGSENTKQSNNKR